MAIFTEKFDSFACHGDAITATHEGFTFRATVARDDDNTPPWQQEDGHGPVTDWTKRAKRPGERVLNKDRNSSRFYDFRAAVKLAKLEKWDTPPYMTGTPGERAARAAEADFKNLQAWCNDEWDYCGVRVEVSRNGVVLSTDSLWGIERNHPHIPTDERNRGLTEAAEELAGQALESAREKLAELCDCHHATVEA